MRRWALVLLLLFVAGCDDTETVLGPVDGCDPALRECQHPGSEWCKQRQLEWDRCCVPYFDDEDEDGDG